MFRTKEKKLFDLKGHFTFKKINIVIFTLLGLKHILGKKWGKIFKKTPQDNIELKVVLKFNENCS